MILKTISAVKMTVNTFKKKKKKRYIECYTLDLQKPLSLLYTLLSTHHIAHGQH